MNPNFQITGIDRNLHQHLFTWDENALTKMGAVKMIVDTKPEFPCRVSLKDAEIGEEVMLLPFQHHPANSPYQASGPIFIRREVPTAQLAINEIPKMLIHRLISLRAYDNGGMMIAAETIEGKALKSSIHTLFENEQVEYLQLHNASPGCYNCQVNRAK